MAENKSVTVLAPNGRRQNVKVTPNTTILQILEEVCKKQGYKPEEYDLRHHNHVVDTSAIIRFSGLPNNAQLEMATALKAREESSVVLGLQMESGDRLMGTFQPTVTLWDVLQNLCPEEADPESNPVVIYMRREVSGMQLLAETTLRSLGLTGGRAMLRFVHSTPEQLHRQANVSAPLQQRPSAVVVNKRTNAYPERSAKQPSPVLEKTFPTSSEAGPVAMEVDEPTPVAPAAPLADKAEIHMTESVETYSLSLSETDKSVSLVAEQGSSATVATLVEADAEANIAEPEIILLGERNAIVFSLAMAQSVPCEDLPEDFYELTMEDARALYRDIRQARAGLDDAPLVTAAARELAQSTRVLAQLGSYKRAVLRVQFPDQTVLQGTFLPLETVGMVAEFVQKYLDNPQVKFHLFTTPPKEVLSPESRLVEVGCVPTAVLHFGLDKNESADAYLRPELLTRLTSPSAAAVAASHSRGLVATSRPTSAAPHPAAVPGPSASGSSHSSATPSTSRQPAPRQDYGPNSKVPKWFKPMK